VRKLKATWPMLGMPGCELRLGEEAAALLARGRGVANAPEVRILNGIGPPRPEGAGDRGIGPRRGRRIFIIGSGQLGFAKGIKLSQPQLVGADAGRI